MSGIHPFQAGVVDVGAHTVRLELFEVDRKGETTVLESLARGVNLGRDVFRRGFVTPETMAQFSGVMCDYAEKLREYRIKKLRAVATSAVREAFNRDLVIDRIRHDSGITLEILESAQEVRLVYLAMRDELIRHFDFVSRRGIVVMVGSGSLFVVGFSDGLMRFCEEIPIGTERLADAFGSSGGTPVQLLEMLQSQDLPRRIAEGPGLGGEKELTFVALGAPVRQVLGVRDAGLEISVGAAEKLLRKAAGPEADPESAATATILNYFLREFRCGEFICSPMTTRAAVVRDFVRQRRGVENPFHEDLRAVCESVGRKYGFDGAHAAEVSRLSRLFFTKLKSDFDLEPREEALLEIASMLHDIGRFVDARKHHLHSWYLISNTQLPGLSAAEHRIVAAVARYHRAETPANTHAEYTALAPGEKVTVLKLAAILRVTDALDCSRRARFAHLKLRRRGVVLELRTPGRAFAPEKLYLGLKGGLFTQVYGLKLKIEEAL